ncbi:hypothetical protein CHUAL_011388 [Chamberlinius hualienensis]
MADLDREFSVDSVYAFIAENGGKVTSGELAKHFRKYLIDYEHGDENKALFKDYVNSVAVLKRIGTENILVLKSRMHDSFPAVNNDESSKLQARHEITDIDAGTVRQLTSAIENRENDNETSLRPQSGVADHSADNETEYIIAADQSMVVQQPVAPPRRRHTVVVDKEHRSSTSELNNNELESRQELLAEDEPRVVSVKEQAQKLNKIASDSQLVPQSNHSAPTKKFHREMRFDRNADDEDSASVTLLDAQAKEWIVNAAKANYQELVKLLKQNPSLAKQLDITSVSCSCLFFSFFKHLNIKISSETRSI